MIIPTYIKNNNQENYHEELNQTLQENVGEIGFVIPSLNTATISSLLSSMLVGTLVFNTTLAKLQIKTADGVIETITSSP